MSIHFEVLVYCFTGLVYLFTKPSIWKFAFLPLIVGFLIFIVVSGVLMGIFAGVFFAATTGRVPPSAMTGALVSDAVYSIILGALITRYFIMSNLFHFFKQMMFWETYNLKLAEYGHPTIKWKCTCCTPCSIFQAILRDILFFVLCALCFLLLYIPVIGWILFYLAVGIPISWALLSTWFEIKGVHLGDQFMFVRLNLGDCSIYGALSLFLTLLPIPFVNIIFSFSCVVGAAMWAVDMECGKIPFDTNLPQKYPHAAKEPLLGQAPAQYIPPTSPEIQPYVPAQNRGSVGPYGAPVVTPLEPSNLV